MEALKELGGYITDMIYNHAPDWVYAIKTLGSTAKLVFERMFSLSKDGTQPVYIKRQDMADWLGVSLPAITRSFKELANLGLIEEIPSDNKWNNIKNFVINASDKQTQNVTIDSNKTLQGSNKTLLSQTQNVTACSNEMLLSSLDRNIERNSENRVSGTHSNHTPISFNFDYVKGAFDDCVNELLDEKPYLKQVDLNRSLKRYWKEKHTKIKKGYWKKGEKVTEQSLKDSISSWLQIERKPEQPNTEEDFSQDLTDLNDDFILTNFTPADKGNYQQSANDGFTECEVIEDEHSNDEDEHSEDN